MKSPVKTNDFPEAKRAGGMRIKEPNRGNNNKFSLTQVATAVLGAQASVMGSPIIKEEPHIEVSPEMDQLNKKTNDKKYIKSGYKIPVTVSKQVNTKQTKEIFQPRG